MTDELSYDLQPYSKMVNSQLIYHKCPVWNHKAKRNYIVRSPIDLSMTYQRGLSPEPYNVQTKVSINEQLFFLQDQHDLEQPVIQFTAPTVVFWTKERNVWIETKSHPTTAAHNNFTLINGWWNLSKWVRPVSFAVQMVDETKPLEIKRGDPLYEVTFLKENNLNADFNLIRLNVMPPDIELNCKRNTRVKFFNPRSNPLHLFTQQQSKCPFAFLKR